jgi:putative membrane protein
MSRIHFTRHFNWRMLLVRTLVNALALMVIVILPDIRFVDRSFLSILVIAIILGILNAVVKPIIQFLTLRFIFITYGFAVVIINTVILLLLDFIVKDRFAVDSLFWAIIGGALMGLVSSFFENLLGLQIPIFPDDAGELPALDADPTKVFERKIVSGVLSPNEELADEISLTSDGSEQVAEVIVAEVPLPSEGNDVGAEVIAAEVPPANEGDEVAAEGVAAEVVPAGEGNDTPDEAESTQQGEER